MGAESTIVILNPDVSKANFLEQLGSGATQIQHWDALNGFAAVLDENALAIVKGSSEVGSSDEDGLIFAAAGVRVEPNAPWGLARLTSPVPLEGKESDLVFNYQYDSAGGEDVDIYVLDTGIHTAHSEFIPNRAKFGKNCVTDDPEAEEKTGDDDVNGHGTAVAAVIAGLRFGVVKDSSYTVIAVKVIGNDGYGYVSDVISGLDYVLVSAARGRGSVVNISLVSPQNFDSLNVAVTKVTDAGIHVVVAAGNDNKDATAYSPANVPSAICVGSTDISDARCADSNFGSPIAVFAPGQFIYSAGVEDEEEVSSASGTSYSAAHVSGLIAYLISAEGNITPAEMTVKVQGIAQEGVLKNIPEGTVNYLVHKPVRYI